MYLNDILILKKYKIALIRCLSVLFLLLYIKLNEKVLEKQGGQILCSLEWSHFSFGKTRRTNPLLIKGFGFFLRKNKEDIDGISE
jgi:hypothetical protein